MSYTGSGFGGSIGNGSLDIRERLDSIERGDSFAPASIELYYLFQSFTFPPNSSYLIPFSHVGNINGRIFEFVGLERKVRIKQAGVIGYTLGFFGEATGSANIEFQLYQTDSPNHVWSLFSTPYAQQPQQNFIHFISGGVQLVNLPQGGANYIAFISNYGGTGTFTLRGMWLHLVYIGAR